jgi:hypothetical protein
MIILRSAGRFDGFEPLTPTDDRAGFGMTVARTRLGKTSIVRAVVGTTRAAIG